MKTLILTLAAFFSISAFAGNEGGNGGGIAEKNLIFAYLNLESYINLCLSSGSCNITPKEREILIQIENSLKDERKNADQIQFRSEKALPGFFILEGGPRVAKTGDHVGDPIYVNIDLLYPKGPDGEIEPVGIPLAISILIHEFGHHHGIEDHTTQDYAGLDILGTKVETEVLSESEESTYQYYSVLRLKADLINTGAPIPQLLVNDGYHVTDFSNAVKQGVRSICPKGPTDFKKVEISNLHWSRIGDPSTLRSGDKNASTGLIGKSINVGVQLRFNLMIDCKDQFFDFGPAAINLEFASTPSTPLANFENDERLLKLLDLPRFEFGYCDTLDFSNPTECVKSCEQNSSFNGKEILAACLNVFAREPDNDL